MACAAYHDSARVARERAGVIIIVYSETTARTVEDRLGKSEYSYYFVLKEFLPVLETLGRVVHVTDPAREVDPIFLKARDDGEDCVFISFMPPHFTTLGLQCPTIPVFAWEFDTIPNETWFREREQDWRYVLNRLGKAITHSESTVKTVKQAMGADFPIVSIPAPVWDQFFSHYDHRSTALVPVGTRLKVVGTVIDSRTYDLVPFAGKHWYASGKPPAVPLGANRKKPTSILLDGVIYVSVFNPGDGRKNWQDMVHGFYRAFRNTPDATLILKLTHHESDELLGWILEFLYRLTPFECRIVLLTGFLKPWQYEALIKTSSYGVNTSHGEGQCLPLMEGMACGKPAIAPCHTGMSDYIHRENAFIVQSSAEPTLWPHDPRVALRALRQRNNFDSLVSAYAESYRVAKKEPARYARMGEQAQEAMRRHASAVVVAERLHAFLKTPPRPPVSDERYGRINARPETAG
jgi:glycosyltransferase involved in cell wall biosynthesis